MADKHTPPPGRHVPALSDEEALQLLHAMRGLECIVEPRQRGKIKYPLNALLCFSLCAMLAGYDSFVLMAAWTTRNGPSCLEAMQMPALPAMPSHDTFRRLFTLIKPECLEAFVRGAVAAMVPGLDGQLVLIDGKALRGTWGPKAKKDATLTLLNAYAPDLRLTLGTRAVGAATNESAQLPALIESLELKGATVCIDAAGAYREVAAAVHKAGASYILTLKANQPSLPASVEALFTEADLARKTGAIPAGDLDRAVFHSCSKGRQLDVEVETISWLDWFEEKEKWPGLGSVSRLIRRRMDEYGKSTEFTIYLLSGLKAAGRILAGAQGRWAIENVLHWTLDVSFGEDACRVRETNAAHNLGLLRRLAHSLLKNTPAEPRDLSIKGKRLLCSSDNSFILRVLGTMNSPMPLHA